MLTVRIVAWLFTLSLLSLNASLILGQTYPNRPIRIVTAPPGGGNDFESRLIAQALNESWGQPVIVDNRPVPVMAGIVARSQPDGYTLFGAGSSTVFAPLFRKMDYDAVKDFAPISRLGSAPNVLVVHPSIAVSSVNELIALAKAKPGHLNYSTGGPGSSQHISGELFKFMAGVNFVAIPYGGGGPAVIALVGGQVQLMFSSAPAVTPHVKSGKLRALAHTGIKPSALAPGVPTVAASGLPGYEFLAYDYLAAPANTPTAITRRLNQEIVRLLTRPDVIEKFLNAGIEADSSSPEEFSAIMKSEMAKVAKLIKDAGIRAD